MTLLVLDIIVIVSLVAAILLQRSEGGGLGLGTSSQGMFTARGAASFLNRATLALGALFFAIGIALVVVGRPDAEIPSVLDAPERSGAPADSSGSSIEVPAGSPPEAPADKPSGADGSQSATPSSQGEPPQGVPGGETPAEVPLAQ